MKLKKFDEYIKENILDNDDDIENNWEIRIDNETDSFWEYKLDAMDRILEILDTNSEISLEEYEEDITLSELADELNDLDEIDFYEKLENLKNFVDYNQDIKLINIADDDEIEFLEEE